MTNPYIPYSTKLDKVMVENEARDIKTLRLVFDDPADRKRFDFRAGQFAEVSMLGIGESPIGMASSPLDADYVEFTVKRHAPGLVTNALHNAEPGCRLGLRGPLGNGYPLEKMAGRDVVIIGGGFAVTTLRATLRYLMHPDIRPTFGMITVVYGARSMGELCYRQEFMNWAKQPDIAVHLTVDQGAQGWSGKVGFVPAVVAEVRPEAHNAVCLVCGPPVMLKFTIPELLKLGFKPEDTYLSLEMRMSCGIGKCGRCNIGAHYVCVDGPVFSLAEVQNMTGEY